MDKRKLKPLGGAKRASGNKEQGGGTELDDGWRVVHEEEMSGNKEQGGGAELDDGWRFVHEEYTQGQSRQVLQLKQELMALKVSSVVRL